MKSLLLRENGDQKVVDPYDGQPNQLWGSGTSTYSTYKARLMLKHHDFGIYPELLNGEALKLRQGRGFAGVTYRYSGWMK
jgi:hypothetical protein